MPRRGITLADVQRAKAALEARNERVSADNVRAFLGTGNKATILNLLAELQGRNFEVPAPAEPLPSELNQALSVAAAGWYVKARSELTAHAAELREKLQEEERQLAEVRAEALAAQARCEEIEDELANARTELAASIAEKATVLGELRRTQQELATALGIAASERTRADVAISDAKDARRLAADELNARIALERDKATLLEAAKSARSLSQDVSERS